MPNEINIIDVTLRDGGYINSWSFSMEEALSVCAFTKDIGVKKIEIGYLSDENSRTLVDGCPVSFLKQIGKFYDRSGLVGMLRPTEKNIDAVVAERASYIGLIRIPCTFNDIENALAMAKIVQRYNIAVSINIIIVSMYTNDEIEKILKVISQSKYVDIIYFADSRGALLTDEVASLISLAKSICHQPLGFHAHNHLGKAIENSQSALEHGCTFIDGSMNGYGDGGGNASLGKLLKIYSPYNQSKQSIDTVIDNFCNKNLLLKFPESKYMELFRLCASKNIDHVWIDDLLHNYEYTIDEILHSSPRKKYKTLTELLSLVNCQEQQA